jgi:hypothetical protein
MEPLSHYHCEIYHCKPVPINEPCINHASTCTSTYNQYVPKKSASTMHQPVINMYHKQVHQPCINLYHKQVHQPVINLYHKQVHPTMCQVCTNHVSTTSTMTHQYVPTSSTIHLMYVCQLINYLSQPCTQHVPQPKSLINFIIQI